MKFHEIIDINANNNIILNSKASLDEDIYKFNYFQTSEIDILEK